MADKRASAIEKEGQGQANDIGCEEVDEVDEEGFAYNVVPLCDPMVSMQEGVDNTIMILDTATFAHRLLHC